MGLCCNTRKKIEGNFNVTEEQVLEKIHSVKQVLLTRFPEISDKSLKKIDHIKSIENITNTLIIMGTIVEDDFIENSCTLTQEELNRIYIFLCEVENLISKDSRDFSLYNDIFEENKELYEKLRVNFNNPRLVKINSSMSTEIDEMALDPKNDLQISKK